MDTRALNELLAGTLTTQTLVQTQKQLEEAENLPGFLQCLLSVLLDPSTAHSIRTAALIYLKNRVLRCWSPKNDGSCAELPEEEKQNFKNAILSAMPSIGPQHRSIFLHIINTIMRYDYPAKWPQLLTRVKEFLSSSDAAFIEAGFSLFLQVNLFYRWSSNEVLRGLDTIFTEFYPAILLISERFVQERGVVANQILYDFCKIYKKATARMLPSVLRDPGIAGRTVALFLQIIVLETPPDIMKLSNCEKLHLPLYKAKKWATFDLLRMQATYFSRRARMASRYQEYKDFGEFYTTTFSPKITLVVLGELQNWSAKQQWLSPSICINLVGYLTTIIENKQCWALLATSIEGFIEHVIYEMLCVTEDDVELFDEDPVEYIHRNSDMYYEAPTLPAAASKFLLTMARKRKSTTPVVLQFLQMKIRCFIDNDLATAVRRVGILRLFQALSPLLIAKNGHHYDQVEPVLRDYVTEYLDSPHSILRMHACICLGSYTSCPFNDRALLQKIYEKLLKCLFDENLAVEVEACLTLQNLLEHEDVKAALRPHVQQIVQHILNLTRKIDFDSLLVVVDELVGLYPAEIAPFAVQLAAQLRDQFLLLASELHEAGMVGQDSSNIDSQVEDKLSIGLGILKSLTSLQLSLEHQNALLLELDTAISPIFEAVYRNKLSDFYQEIYALHENTLYTCKTVTPTQWRLLGVAVDSLEELEFSYLDEAMPLLENYVCYGSDHLASHPEDLSLLVNFVNRILSASENSTITFDEKKYAVMLETRMLVTPALQNGAISQFLEPLLLPVLHLLEEDKIKRSITKKDNPDGSRTGPVLICAVLGGLQCNTRKVLEVLDSRGATSNFFSLWFGCMDQLSRVDDMKLEVLAILALVRMTAENSVQIRPAELAQLLGALAKVLELLPGAIVRRDALAEKFGNSVFNDDFDYDDRFDLEELVSEGNEDEEVEDVYKVVASAANEMKQGLEFSQISNELAYQEQKPLQFEMYDAATFEEELDVPSPLDSINPWVLLKDTFTTIALARPDFHQELLASLSEHDKCVLEQSVARAEAS